MTPLVIGSGLVGSQVARILVERGEKPVLMDHAAQNKAIAEIVDLAKVTLVAGDVLRPLSIVDALRSHQITKIVHTAANPLLTAPQVAQILKETASGAGRWTPDLGFGVIDVAAAVARAQAGVPGVLLSGNRVDTRVQLNWGGDGTRYSLSLSKDSSPASPVLADTQLTSTTLTLTRGHSYSFTVAALDASGAALATSAPLTLALAARARG